jgi:hypothetical protein
MPRVFFQKRNCELEERLATVTASHQQLKEKNETLEKNISSLIKTARFFKWVYPFMKNIHRPIKDIRLGNGDNA